jgi:hypothetical protein
MTSEELRAKQPLRPKALACIDAEIWSVWANWDRFELRRSRFGSVTERVVEVPMRSPTLFHRFDLVGGRYLACSVGASISLHAARILDLSNQTWLDDLPLSGELGVLGVDVGSTGARLALQESDGGIVWNIERFERECRLPATIVTDCNFVGLHPEKPTGASDPAFAIGGYETLAITGPSGTLLHQASLPGGDVMASVWTSRQQLVTGGTSAGLEVWNADLSAYRSIQVARPQHASKCNAIESLLAWNEEHVVCTCSDGNAYFVSLETGKASAIGQARIASQGPQGSVILATLEETRQVSVYSKPVAGTEVFAAPHAIQAGCSLPPLSRSTD